MIKASLVAMAVLTVLIALALGWRDRRLGRLSSAPSAGFWRRGRRLADRWLTAAALAAVTTMLVMGGIHWLRLSLH